MTPTFWPAKTTEIYFAAFEAYPATPGDADRVVVKRGGEFLKSPVDAGRSHVELSGDFHAQGLVWPCVVIALEEGIEAGLLLEDVGGGGLGGFRLEGEMHAFVPTILLRRTGLDALEVEAEPPDGEGAEAIQRMGRGKGHAVVGANDLGKADSLKVRSKTVKAKFPASLRGPRS